MVVHGGQKQVKYNRKLCPFPSRRYKLPGKHSNAVDIKFEAAYIEPSYILEIPLRALGDDP
jgi:hypothetical protein